MQQPELTDSLSTQSFQVRNPTFCIHTDIQCNNARVADEAYRFQHIVNDKYTCILSSIVFKYLSKYLLGEGGGGGEVPAKILLTCAKAAAWQRTNMAANVQFLDLSASVS